MGDRKSHPLPCPQAGLGVSQIVLLETQESQEVAAGSPIPHHVPLSAPTHPLPACLLRGP